MRITEIITENIFTTDYRKVMQAVAELYQNHYNVNIWSNAEAHDEAAKVLMKEHPNLEELDYIIKNAELPERFQELDFPINDDIMLGINAGDEDLDEGPASRKLCLSSKPNSKLGASNLASCKSQGYRKREGKMTYKIGGRQVRSAGKEIRGRKYGGPLPDYSD
jgi:hypothetical protein